MTEKQQRVTGVLEGYAPTIGSWAWALEDTRGRTKRSLEGINEGALHWSEGPGANTIATLLYHIAAIEVDYLYTDILEQPFPEQVVALFPHDVRDDEGRLTSVAQDALEQHLHRLDTTHTLVLSALRDMTSDDFQRPRQLAEYDISPAWVIHHLMQHEAEHRGQIEEIRARAERALGPNTGVRSDVGIGFDVPNC